MKRKITLALVTVLFLLTAVLTGCGQTKKDTAVKGESVVVKFSYPPYGYDSNLEDAFWKKYVAEFEKENPNIKIDMTVESWDNVYTKWEQYFASGDTPDVGYADGVQGVEYGLQGKALPVTEVVNALGGEQAFTKDAKSFQTKGEWYAVPNCVAEPVLA